MLVSLVFALLAVARTSQAAAPLANVYSSCKNKGDVALTFDDGPYLYLQNISNTLFKAGAVGTFFFNGNNWRCIYDPDSQTRAKYAHSQGHMIGSHTWAHLNLTSLTSDQINSEMMRVEQALERIIGVKPAFMRPPYGLYNNLVRQVAYTRNQSLALWDFDSGDSTGSTVQQSETLYDGVVRSHPNSVLAVNHETSETTALTVLPYAIQKLQGAGYKLVSLATCLGMPAYQSVGAPGKPDSTWTC
ncbi:carbohydrate esterase family 4 protein [Mycena epipterygia]|nr:carbohydrate esterase family 4 protein [Mycena epipterygia]